MWNVLLWGLVLITITSLILCVLAFLGKDIILDDTYIKATEEERRKMNKKAYRLQAGVLYLLIGMMTLCNLLRALTQIVWFTYLAGGITVVVLVYAIVSHYTIKKKNRTESQAAASVAQEPSTSAFSASDISPMEKPIDFAGNTAWAEEIQALETEEVYARYRDADGDWTDAYRYLCYEELLKRKR